MKTLRHIALTIVMCVTIAYSGYGQVPDLGAAAGFALFTAAGQFEVSGNSTTVTGDVGTNVGAFIGFPPGVLLGTIHVADEVTAQAAPDVLTAFGYLAALTCGQVLTPTLGNGQILAPNIYCIGQASTLNGNLILDGQNDPNAIFIFQINGAFATSTNTNILLINAASLCNVFWQINGEFTLGEGSNFLGTIINSGAIHLLEGATLTGSALSTAGAIDLHNNLVTLVTQPIAPTIIADGPEEFCIGESVTLSGNIDGIWNTGETTPTITVDEGGDYFVISSNECGSDLSNVISVTVHPLPIINISGEPGFCQGESTILTASAGASYLWSTNETTE